MVFFGCQVENFEPPLGSLAFAVIDRAAQETVNGFPIAGAWLLSDTAQDWADLAGLDAWFAGGISQ